MDPLKSNEGLHLKNQMEQDMLYGQICCFVLHLLPIIAIHYILVQIGKKLQFSKKRLLLYASNTSLEHALRRSLPMLISRHEICHTSYLRIYPMVICCP